MLDGYVTAIVAGPISFDPREWICPLLAINADAFNHGSTPKFAAISAVSAPLLRSDGAIAGHQHLLVPPEEASLLKGCSMRTRGRSCWRSCAKGAGVSRLYGD
jgi:hypothetical protein